MRVVLLLAILVLTAGCATLSEDTCRAGNWEEIGFRDGADGRTSDHIIAHARACNDYGIAPQRGPWEKGRREGLALYCTPDRAWREGAEGRRLSPVCPLAEARFLIRQNERGLDYYRTGREIDAAERRMHDITRFLRDLPDGDASRAGLVAERAALRLEVQLLRTERLRYRF